MPKKWKVNIINGTVHTGLSEILSDNYACGKRQIFAKDFAKEWVGYAISLASITIAKESLFGIAIAKFSVNGPERWLKYFLTTSTSQLNNIRLEKLYFSIYVKVSVKLTGQLRSNHTTKMTKFPIEVCGNFHFSHGIHTK